MAQAFSDSSCLVFCLNHDTHSCIRDKTSNADVVRLMDDDEIQDACMHNSHFVLEVQLVSLNQFSLQYAFCGYRQNSDIAL
jgi:hypothetical protein